MELRSAFTLAPQQGTLKPDGALSTHGNHPVFGVKRKWLIKIRTRAVKAARVVSTRAASSGRSPDVRAVSKVVKAAKGTALNRPRFGHLSPLRRGLFLTLALEEGG